MQDGVIVDQLQIAWFQAHPIGQIRTVKQLIKMIHAFDLLVTSWFDFRNLLRGPDTVSVPFAEKLFFL